MSEEDINELTNQMSNLNMLPRFGMKVAFPFLLYDYFKNKRRHCSIDFFVFSMGKHMFKPCVLPGGKAVSLSVIVPKMFPKANRLMLAHANERFTINTHKATAFEEISEVVQEKYNLKDDEDAKINSIPQVIKLPFKCDEEIVDWEIQYFGSDDEKLTNELGAQPFNAILTVEVMSVIKPKKKKRGSTRVFGTVRSDSDDGEEEDDAEAMADEATS